MNTKLYLYIVLRVVIFFAIAIAMTYIPENCREFFGDTLRETPTFGMDINYDWGSRHYWFWWGSLILALVSIADAVISIVNMVFKIYPHLK